LTVISVTATCGCQAALHAGAAVETAELRKRAHHAPASSSCPWLPRQFRGLGLLRSAVCGLRSAVCSLRKRGRPRRRRIRPLQPRARSNLTRYQKVVDENGMQQNIPTVPQLRGHPNNSLHPLRPLSVSIPNLHSIEHLKSTIPHVSMKSPMPFTGEYCRIMNCSPCSARQI
jgi:hypothetical protein